MEVLRPHTQALWLLTLFFCISAQGSPSFRIIAPQSICGTRESLQSVAPSDSVTISFQPRHGVKLTYTFHVFFKTIGTYRSQRRTLEIWRSVRSLERRINVRDSSVISERNMVTINKTEVTPGVVYIFHVVGVTDKGDSSKSKNFTIKYSNGSLSRGNKNQPAEVNFLLLGSGVTIASIPYTLTAKVSFCEPNFDYFFNWNILGFDEQMKKYLRTSASVLRIPENIFEGGTTYEVDVSIHQSNKSMEIAENYIIVEVLKRGFEISMIPTKVTTGINQPVYLEVVITDFDNSKSPFEVSWVCLSGNKLSCEDYERLRNTKIKIGFDISGRYVMGATVKMKDLNQSATSEILVDPNVFISYEFLEVPNFLVAAGQRYEFSLNIENLTTGCKAEWDTVNENGFASFPSSKSTEHLGSFTVRDIYSHFLAELIDVENSTTSITTELTVPESSPSWVGFKGDSKYKFQLSVICPNPSQSDNADKREDIESIFEFILKTNSPPKGRSLEVIPRVGFALKTNFQFTTGDAKDKQIDAPLSYEFIYQVENYTVSIGHYNEYKVADTTLPYSESHIKTMYRVCDNKLACAVVTGPDIKVEITNISKKEVYLKKEEIGLALRRMDIFTAQNIILAASLTYKKLAETELYTEFKIFCMDILSKEIDKQYELPSEAFYLTREDIFKFVKLVKQNFDVLDVSEITLIQKLLDLLDSAAEESESTEMLVEFRKKRHTKILQPSRSIVDHEYAHIFLEIMEKKLLSTNETQQNIERSKVTGEVSKLVASMCKSNKISKANMKASFVAIEMKKLPGNQINGINFTVRNDFTSEDVSYVVSFPELQSRKKFCVTTVLFPEDYLADMNNSTTYSIHIYDISTTTTKQVIFASHQNNVANIVLPSGEEDVKCLMWSEQSANWTTSDCQTQSGLNKILCTCQRLGFLKLGKTEQGVRATSLSSVIPQVASEVTTPTTKVTAPNTDTKAATSSIAISTLVAQTPIEITTPLVNEKNSNENRTEMSASTIATASTIDYIIPFLCLSSILFLIGGVVLYQRRRMANPYRIHEIDITEAEPRQSEPGIKYAKFNDEHVMIGDF